MVYVKICTFPSVLSLLSIYAKTTSNVVCDFLIHGSEVHALAPFPSCSSLSFSAGKWHCLKFQTAYRKRYNNVRFTVQFTIWYPNRILIPISMVSRFFFYAWTHPGSHTINPLQTAFYFPFQWFRGFFKVWTHPDLHTITSITTAFYFPFQWVRGV